MASTVSHLVEHLDDVLRFNTAARALLHSARQYKDLGPHAIDRAASTNRLSAFTSGLVPSPLLISSISASTEVAGTHNRNMCFDIFRH